MNINYLIQGQGIPCSEIAEQVQKTEGLALREMKVSDLIFYKEEPIYRACGVYVFRIKNNVVYVGSCVSRCFVERIPAHFDIRNVGWFNSLLKSILKLNAKELDEINLLEAAKFAMLEMNVVLINFSNPHAREEIMRLEHDLILTFKTNNRKPSLKRFNLLLP